jgi:hypothetical protein
VRRGAADHFSDAVVAIAITLLALVSRSLNGTPCPPRQVVNGVVRQRYLSTAGFGLSIPLFFVTTDAWLLWFIVPPLAGRVSRLRRRDGHGPRTGQAAGLSAG